MHSICFIVLASEALRVGIQATFIKARACGRCFRRQVNFGVIVCNSFIELVSGVVMGIFTYRALSEYSRALNETNAEVLEPQ